MQIVAEFYRKAFMLSQCYVEFIPIKNVLFIKIDTHLSRINHIACSHSLLPKSNLEIIDVQSSSNLLMDLDS